MSGVPKLLLIYAVAIPLAIVLGFLVSAPGMGSLVVIGLLIFLFLIPVLLKSHHFLLIIFWNSVFNVFFLPAQPHFWLLLAFLSFGISWLNNIMGEKNFIQVPELTWPLLIFGVVILVTMAARGGLGARAAGGSSYGGKGYIYMIGGIVGYFALTAQRIPLRDAGWTTGWFLISGVTAALSNLVFVLGPSFYVLYLLLPPEFALFQASADTTGIDTLRIAGLPTACSAVIYFLLARYGLKSFVDWRRPWIGLVVLAMLALSGFGGYRSAYLTLGLLFFCHFLLEGLHRTALSPLFLGLGLVGAVFVAAFSMELPLSVQRSLSFLPIKVDTSVALDADHSSQWRIDLWKIMAPDIPEYLILGKGYRIDPEDLYLADIASQMGLADTAEVSRLSGDYHSGPLSVLIPFGALGAIAVLWLFYAGSKCLWQNYRYGDPMLRNINTFLLAIFLTNILSFLIIFGDIRYGLFLFTGTLGLSVSLNGGVVRRPVATPRRAAVAQLQPQLA